VQQASNALLVQKLIYLWAAKVNDYRRSPATFMYGPLTTVGLLVYTMIIFGFANLGIYHFSAQQFVATREPSLLVFIYYSLTGLYSGEIEVLVPVGNLAVVVKIMLGVIGPLLLAVLAAGLFQNYRLRRDAEAADKVVSDLRGYVRELEGEFHRDYYLSPAQALAKLAEMGSGLVRILSWITAQTASSIEPMESRRLLSGKGNRP
jgi:hypothetical protein